ncbi:MFS transporter [Actinomadura rugatobispora]|uniref:MFS transporter n=1 Tax=Actinomadura rugatobispora TaxID=1994 RepID=A0ABW0ZWZ2_9ACTN
MTISPDRSSTPTGSPHARILIVLIAIEVFAVFETAMAIAAIPTFMRVFEADAAAVGWTTTAYLLVGAASAATAGRLGDIFGRRNVLVFVLAAAACGSLISVLAADLWMVTLGRGVQGLAAGALPLSFALVRELLPERRVPLAIALLGGIVPICAGGGALLAGVLLDHSGWRLMFIVATAMGTAAALTGLIGLPRTPGLRPRPSVDMVGAVLLVPATGGVLFGVTQGEKWGWTDPRVLLPIGLGLAALALWVWWERRVREPIVDVRQFGDRKVALTTLATVLVGLGPMGASSIMVPVIMQLPERAPVGHGLTATTSGVVMLFIAVIGYGGAAVSGRIAQLMGARWSLLTACVLYIAGGTMWIFLVQNLPGTIGCLILINVGSAFAFSALPILIVEVVPSAQTGAATGMNRVTLNVSIACGLSLTSVIMATRTVPGTHLPTEAAITSACLLIIGAAVVSLVLAALIGSVRRTPVPAAPPAPGLGPKRAAA